MNRSFTFAQKLAAGFAVVVLFATAVMAISLIRSEQLRVVSNGLQSVSGEPVENPARAVLLGPVRVAAKELPGITCRAIDVELSNGQARECAAQIVAEMAAPPRDAVVAYRRGERFIEVLEHLTLARGPDNDRADAKIGQHQIVAPSWGR